MSEPFIYIATYHIKPEFEGDVHQRTRDLVARVEEQEQQLLSFHFYLDEDRGRLICVQVHPDPESMVTHMAVIADHIAKAWDWLDMAGSTQLVLGTPPSVLTEFWGERGKDLDRYPTFVAGFTRAASRVSAPG